ncbi:MAG: ORF6N domain-containing protein [Cyanobacteria bacterium SIG28]|nr:ORF6N domain-containing protein [Cyanobacteria bacterium SIG28]
MNSLVEVKNLIYEVRGYKVMLDSDLADLYEVPTKRLNEAVKRNLARFPTHYMFQLTNEEFESLRSQIATSNKTRGGRRYMPYVFTEQGVAMLSTVLNSEKAIQINIKIIDTFVQMRQWALDNKELTKRVADIENYLINYAKDNNKEIEKIYEAIDLLMDRTKPRKIGFNT